MSETLQLALRFLNNLHLFHKFGTYLPLVCLLQVFYADMKVLLVWFLKPCISYRTLL
jgi:hypothetical protein